MFEKEVKEYRKDVKSKFFLSEPQLDLACQGFKDGYNKANEWHYNEVPNNDNDILCQISKDEVVVGYYHTVAKRYITIDGQDLYNVIAWKEIVLPELKESE